MSKTKAQKHQELASVWSVRVSSAEQYYDDWAMRYRVDDLEDAYYGHQWDESDSEEYQQYVMNMFFSSIDVKMPQLLFKKPNFSINPRPSKMDFDSTGAQMRSRLKQDTLNYFVQGGIPEFAEQMELATLDAFFRFGVIEVGYSGDFIQNPNAGKPYLVSGDKPLTDKKGQVVRHPDVMIDNEKVYVRRILPERFRVGGMDQDALSQCSWYGYIDYIRKEDLYASARVNRGYNVEAIEKAEEVSPDSRYDTPFQYNARSVKDVETDMVAVWKIYDLRSKRMLMFNKAVSELIYSEPIDRPKHFILKFRKRLKGFYPLPITYNWISPQTAVNETRESARKHRWRFLRKYIARENAFDETELDKLQNGDDGTVSITKMSVNDSIAPLASPSLNAQHNESIATSRDDFDRIAATSAEQRGQSDRSTATQSKIKEARSSVREARDQAIVATFYCSVGKEILQTAIESLALPFWVKISSDGPGLFSEIEAIEEQYQLIAAEDLGDDDFEVTIKLSTDSPIDREAEEESLMKFLAIIAQYPQVSMSPAMVREAADRVGFRNERAVADIVRSAQLMQTLQIVQLTQQTGQDPQQLFLESVFMRNAGQPRGGSGGNQQSQGNPAAQRQIAQQTPPGLEQINNQVNNQLTQGQ